MLRLSGTRVGKKLAYLHNELDGTDEETKELEEEILLLFLHLIETILLASLEDLLGSETETGISGDCDAMVSQLCSIGDASMGATHACLRGRHVQHRDRQPPLHLPPVGDCQHCARWETMAINWDLQTRDHPGSPGPR